MKGVPLSLQSIFQTLGMFLGSFAGSIAVGVFISLVYALILKHTKLYEFHSLETCITLLVAYSSYVFSNAIQLSGIVSLLFCGLTLKHYAYDNMSETSKSTTKNMFQALSQLSENFIFIYLGVTIFTKKDQDFIPTLIVSTLFIIMVARYISVIPLAELINSVSRRIDPSSTPKIPRNHQLMIWWAGLRGAIAFALSYELDGPNAAAMQTTILMVCVISIIVLGGSTPIALEYLKIKMGDQVIEDEDLEFEDFPFDDEREGILMARESSYPPSWPAFETYRDQSHWFLSFDERWLKPLFTRYISHTSSPKSANVNLIPRQSTLLFTGDENVNVIDSPLIKMQSFGP